MTKDFLEIRNAYKESRTAERTNIIDLLRKVMKDENDLVIKNSGLSGRGGQKYKGGKPPKPALKHAPFDLSNWIYVEGSFKNNERFWHFMITLQCIEQDNDTLNWHILMDRIGIMLDEIDEQEHNNAKIGRKYSYDTHKLGDWNKSLTPFDLPIKEIKKEEFITELYSDKHIIQVF